jgi:hypothetical protein
MIPLAQRGSFFPFLADFSHVSRAQYWILNFTSVLVALVVGFEMYSSDKLDEAQLRAREAQLPLLQAEQLQPIARRMVERIAQGTAVDPALKDLLAKQGLQVTITPRSPRPESAGANP